MSKPPTPQGISRLLAKAGFERSTSSATRIKGWRNSSEGFQVSSYGDEVYVRHMTGFGRGEESARRKVEQLAEYTTAIRAAGWSVTGPATEGFQELTVTAGEDTPNA